jgi:serine protease AprX
MDDDLVKDARKQLRKQYGTAFAEKASDNLCFGLARTIPRSVTSFGLEMAIADAPRPSATIVEFEEGEGIAGLDEEAESMTAALGQLQSALETAVGRTEPFRPAGLLRQARVKAFRDNFYSKAGQVNDHLERLSGLGSRAGLETVGSGGPSPSTYTCWLNQTIRTTAEPSALAEIASDEQVRHLDIPRRLQAETAVSMKTIGLAPMVKRTKLSGKGITVGVLDSEVALNHPSFGGRVVHRRNYTQEPWGNPAVHGTAVAGIIGSLAPRMKGVAPNVTIYNYKILGTSPAFDSDDFFAWRAIQDALEDGVDVINCSWGAGPARDGTGREARACDVAWRFGLVIVKSAGNKGPAASTLTSPADAEGVIVVGATNRQGTTVEDYSSRGPTPGGLQRPHILAPGGSFEDGIRTTIPGGTGAAGAGTSYAAPHIAGVIALLLEQNSALTPSEMREILLVHCSPLAGVDSNIQGAGLISLSNYSP